MNALYNFQLTPGAWGYIRQVLGARPHDEVRPLIAQLEQEAAQQEAQAQQPRPEAFPAIADPAKRAGNGALHPEEG